MDSPLPPFLRFLHEGQAAGGFENDDAVAALLPLFQQAAAAHAEGRVAPFEDISGLTLAPATPPHLRFDPAACRAPRKAAARLDEIQGRAGAAVEVIEEVEREADLDAQTETETHLQIGEPGAALERPVYLPAYACWEHRCGHHDPLTDLFSLGLLLASLACALDFTADEDLALFVRNRENLFRLNPRLHPVLAATIVELTELNRHRRAQSLETIIVRLRHYREQVPGAAPDLRRLQGFREGGVADRRKIVLSHLRNRLFEISRRNRLLHFRPTLQTLNLTLTSVPILLDHRNIQPSQLFLWHDRVAKALSSGESVVLGNYVRFEDAPYAAGVLDQIIATERRDRAEFGFAQLRLVVCFLRWHNLKETPEERVNSPLVLLPVELTRKKGVRDAYLLRPLTQEAEINPALRHHLRQLYGLDLPATLDLGATSLDEFHALLAAQIRASEPGVTLVKQDRPQIRLIHERARQRLDQFRRRQRASARAPRRAGAIDYSYERERFNPLGLQLFLQRVKPARLPLADVSGAPPEPRLPNVVEPRPEAGAPDESQPAAAGPTPTVSEKSRQLYSVADPAAGGNPYTWDFDLCSLTLGNFNYRKMSLVRDYATLLERDVAGTAFETVFSLDPRPRDAAPPAPGALADAFPVVECDPTQSLAVTRARAGQSYIIQGPPGTGKSQTITNLIADYVARGKRVLFVCEKRAAIDVVFHRLGRQKLDELCCLIHDSQTDKRDFIRNLKQTYEAFLAQPVDDDLDRRRAGLVRLMELELASLQRWTAAMEARVENTSLAIRGLFSRLLELHAHRRELDPLAKEQVPSYALWPRHAAVVHTLASAIARLGSARSFAEHPFRHLTEQALRSPHPLATITEAVKDSTALLARLREALSPLEATVSLETQGDTEALVAYAGDLLPLATADALDLLNPRAPRTRASVQALKAWRAAEKALEKARAATGGWKEKLTPADTATGLAQARAVEGSLLRWLNPSFWRLRKLFAGRYDFTRHALRPTWVQLFTELEAEHAAVAAEAEARRALEESFGSLAAEAGIAQLEQGPAGVEGLPPAARAFHAYLIENPEDTYTVEKLAALREVTGRLRTALGLALADYGALSRSAQETELARLRADLTWLPDLLPVLLDALSLPPPLREALRRLPLTHEELEAAMARKSIDAACHADRAFEATDGRILAQRFARLREHHREWLALNARCVHQRVRREFLRKVRLSGLPAAQLSPEEKEFKKRYATGRRGLEHEFGKTMRHRSIRDLADDETGLVLRDLKPVWLMSPLSVSDTLPLATDAFDVVIFDEASQITVEEAVPAIFRAAQAIVVGDEMQLPPTNFFSASRSEEALEDEGEELAGGELDADSFLTQSARNLPSTMLGWHYRSRSESLISFSNHAFYEGRLLTVPDRSLPVAAAAGASGPSAGAAADRLLSRAVSFHHLPEAVYEQRCNVAEADYIAAAVRELLARETGLSIGIVAFSEAQQSQIESSLRALGEEDAVFRNRLEAEYERQEDGQFCGLFVKNLENVQGDERDVILLSVCYGPDRNGRMLMNFGPINQRGGEKRLNVIFSRAKRHMAVVSTIRHAAITNDYNDGANCLRHFLEYAAACSAGDAITARRVLRAINPLDSSDTSTPGASDGEEAGDPLAAQLAAALAAKGFLVERNIGQSAFRAPLALRRSDDEAHRLAVLLDDDSHYAQADLLERYLLRPNLLRGFGWRVTLVLRKDWLHDPAAVLRQLEEAFAATEEEPPLPAAEPEPAPPAPKTAVEVPRTTETAGIPPPRIPSVSAPAPTGNAGVPPASVSIPSAPLRRFEATGDGENKFWEISVSDCDLTVRFGKLGGKGQSQTKPFPTPALAAREREKLIRSKLAKGYVEVALR